MRSEAYQMLRSGTAKQKRSPWHQCRRASGATSMYLGGALSWKPTISPWNAFIQLLQSV